MKKVLIISYNPIHDYGGTEIYIEKLIEIFKKQKWDITEFSLDFRNVRDKVNIDSLGYSLVLPSICLKKEKSNLAFLSYFKKAKKELDEYKKNNKFDLIINNIGFGFKWEFIPQNEVLIQHFCIDFYNLLYICKVNFLAKICSFFRWTIIGYCDYLKLHKTIVFFSDLDKQKAQKRYKRNFDDSTYISLFGGKKTIVEKTKKVSTNGKLAFIGRVTQQQKNMKFLIKVAKYLDTEVDIYGTGDFVNKISGHKNINYCGFLSHDMVVDTYSKYLSSICVSTFEGCPFSLTESICSLTPLIVRDTFLNAEILTSNNNGLLLDRKLSPKQCAEKINEFIKNFDLKELTKANKELALKEYTEEVFEKRWIDYIKKF